MGESSLEDAVHRNQTARPLAGVNVFASPHPSTSNLSRYVLRALIAPFLLNESKMRACKEDELGRAVWDYVREEGWLLCTGSEKYAREVSELLGDADAFAHVIDSPKGSLLVVIGSYHRKN